MSRSEDAAPPTGVEIVRIKSRFAMLALREGGKPAAVALKAADAFLQAERGRYLAWVTDTLRQLDHTLDELPGSIPEALQQAYGQAMQIRDLGGTFGAALVTEVADSLCELLYRLHAAGLYNAAAIATHQSVLRLVCMADQARATPDGIAELVAGLKQIVARFPRPQPPVKPAADQTVAAQTATAQTPH
ncbi:MAG: hypothetical protein OJJ21_03595 [Ferrovibrio sp.]|uniref:hypothetical protein n=1 Tax=Ferrovibrio sp. TaxID=1917215 RepID=UPI002626AD6A|nr:hypothetical protein [Ferrovibrio sp.]MCW0232662.1 hypothetical protein [Ferrovibrio sp.]